MKIILKVQIIKNILPIISFAMIVLLKIRKMMDMDQNILLIGWHLDLGPLALAKIAIKI